MGKYIIDIPDEMWEQVKDGYVPLGISKYLKNGTPYNPTGDLISRSDLKTELNSRPFPQDYSTTVLLGVFNELIDSAPTVEQFDDTELQRAVGYADGYSKGREERPQGEWVIDGHHRRCKKCGEYFCIADSEGNEIPSNFCPNCGVDMRRGGAE